MPLVSGATAAGFNIVRLLGGGQTGELYVAEHPRLPRQYALKVLPEDLSADPEYRFRFHQESDQAAALSHPNIVGLHDRGEFEDRLWLAMDYVDGTDAAKLLIDTYPDGMPPDMVIQIVSAIADALDYAHEHGLVHRYVNPSNILITEPASGRRRILLAGFGVARRPEETNSLTRRNLAIGTVSYAAPEQLLDDSIDGQADQYALACTAFHLLTGWPPFAHMKPTVVVSKHLNESPPRPSDMKPQLIYFDAPFARALMKAPAERFPNCREFAKALEARGNLKLPSAKGTSAVTAVETNNASPSEPAVSASPPAEVGEAAATPDVLPTPEVDDSVDAPTVRPESEVDEADTLAEPDVWSAAPDDASIASRRRRMLHAAALGLTIVAVALGGILGVMALRSASQPDDAPANVETLSPATTTPPARPATTTAIPPPIVKAPPPATTTPPKVTASPAATVAPTATSSSTARAPVPETTRAHSQSPTTTPSGLDTRPAVGIPCGAPGAITTSNAGMPVVCADTPGGSAWEPPGG
ncbi:MAG: protein kinase [Mycobacterium sp.]|uniref:serine/threonine-protein kinase n=1 Tax=Mycobacterium sp. TaxID=1785 RepID=UPI003C480F0B